MAERDIAPGDEVSWKWGSGVANGTVAEVKEHGSVSIQSNQGNTIRRNASPGNPAVHIARSGNDVVKRVSELNTDNTNNKDEDMEGETAPEIDRRRDGDKLERTASQAEESADLADCEAETTKKHYAAGSKKNQIPKGKSTAKSKKEEGAIKSAKSKSDKVTQVPAAADSIGSRTRSKTKA
ncbi:MAG: hypothetical protein M1829_006096 [Trizodia sp. TS-e1964]|nr:MAG: hypothetical protein M1829_006096 [Trizodia sp. TS-e1964]